MLMINSRPAAEANGRNQKRMHTCGVFTCVGCNRASEIGDPDNNFIPRLLGRLFECIWVAYLERLQNQESI